MNDKRDSIRPGGIWLDTNGNRIQAHGGSLFFENDTFYWYGENKEHTTPGSGKWHWGVRAYSSTDLYNWEDLGLIIPPVLGPRCLPPSDPWRNNPIEHRRVSASAQTEI